MIIIPLLLFFIIVFSFLILNNLYKYELFSKNTKKYFITFSDGSPSYLDAGERIKSQAEDLNIFDKCIHYSNKHLMDDSEYWNKHKNFIINTTHKKGQGYYIWKPYLIQKTMNKMNDGDILLYLDAGCEIDIKKKNKLLNLINKVKKDLIIGSFTNFKEKCWTKRDLSFSMNVKNENLETRQRQAGLILLLVCPKTRELVNEWNTIAQNYNLLDSSKSKLKNDDCFKDNRHDQSIFSLLTKKYHIFGKNSLTEAINVERNRGGTSKLNGIVYKYNA
jgi:hypothetical protein